MSQRDFFSLPSSQELQARLERVGYWLAVPGLWLYGIILCIVGGLVTIQWAQEKRLIGVDWPLLFGIVLISLGFQSWYFARLNTGFLVEDYDMELMRFDLDLRLLVGLPVGIFCLGLKVIRHDIIRYWGTRRSDQLMAQIISICALIAAILLAILLLQILSRLWPSAFKFSLLIAGSLVIFQVFRVLGLSS